MARFLQATWELNRPDVMAALDAFWRLDMRDFQAANDALLVLLPKSPEASTTKDAPGWMVVWGSLLLGARSGGYNVRRNRFVVPRPKP
jgi:hypothetical protein